MRTKAAFLAAGLVLGAAGGYVAGRGSGASIAAAPGAPLPAEPAADPASPSLAPAPIAPGPRARPGAPAIAAAPANAPAPAIAAAGAPATNLADAHAELAILREEVARLRAEAAVEAMLKKREEGDEVPFPKDLAPRFTQDVLRERVGRALAEAGFDGAEVTSIDCTEYPCIVYGEGMGGREDFDRLSKTNALSEYRDDRRSGFGWASGDKGSETRRFCLAVLPPDDPRAKGDELRRRLQFRVRQMQETFGRE